MSRFGFDFSQREKHKMVILKIFLSVQVLKSAALDWMTKGEAFDFTNLKLM